MNLPNRLTVARIILTPIFMITMVKLQKREAVSWRVITYAMLIFLIMSKYVSRLFVPVMIKNPSLILDRFHYFSPFSLHKNSLNSYNNIVNSTKKEFF